MRTGKGMTALWLLIGVVALVYANGRWMVPLGAWVATTCLLLVSRRTRVPVGGSLVFLATFLSHVFVWRGMLPLPTPIYQIVGAVTALFTTVPFVVDRLVAPRIPRALRSLVFPSASVVFAYALAGLSPSGPFGSVAYTQTSAVLQQVVSLVGIWGIIFVLGWTAATLADLVEAIGAGSLRAIRRPTIAYVATVVSLLAYGYVRLLPTSAAGERVRVAGIVHEPVFAGPVAGNLEAFRRTAAADADQLFRLSRLAAERGADVVFWQEGAQVALRSDEPGLVDRARTLARSHHVYLGLSLVTISERFPQEPGENKIVWITPDGKDGFSYLKAFPTPDENVVRGSATVSVLETSFGRLSSAICFDLDFPSFLREFARADVDLLAVPAHDWRDITPYHARIAGFRALETGIPIVRATGQGLSVAFDAEGRQRAALNIFESGERLMIVDMVVGRRPTLYAWMGDTFPALCLAGLLVFVTIGIVKRARPGE